MTKQVQRRRGTATQHTSFTGAEGEISVNTTNKSVHVHDGVTTGGVEAARADGANVAFTNDITWGDNDKAIFGAGSDLQIYHDGSNSYITDAGVGNLYVEANVFRVYNAAGDEISANFVQNGAVTLYYDNAPKLATTSTGIDVTGTVTADGLTVGGTLGSPPIVRINNVGGNWVSGDEAGRLQFYTTDPSGIGEREVASIRATTTVTSTTASGSLGFYRSGTNLNTVKAMDIIGTTGDIQFYEDTGTTAKFFWDASAERLGIGVTSPNRTLDVRSGTTDVVANFESSDAGAFIALQDNATTTDTAVMIGASGDDLRFDAGDVERMRITSSGSVGIGTTSPETKLDVMETYDTVANILANGTYAAKFTSNAAGAAGRAQGILLGGVDSDIRGVAILGESQNAGNAHHMIFALSSPSSTPTERMRITSSGSVGIGTDSPASIVGGTDTSPVLSIGGTDSVLTTGDKAGSISFITSDTSYTGTYPDGVTGEIASVAETVVGGGYSLAFYTGITTNSNRAERVRIDYGGNVLVGRTDVGFDAEAIVLRERGEVYITSDSRAPLLVNRLTSDGDIASFRKNGTTVGSIGSYFGDVYIGNDTTGLRFIDTSFAIIPFDPTDLQNRDNQLDLGTATVRFDDIYATNGTIQTSDRNEKQDIAELDEAEHRVAVACKGLLRKFRWKDAVAEKGDDARIHFGIIAQDLQAAFAAEGLDAGDYAMFIHTTWWESTEVIPAVAEELDDEGNVVTEAQPERTVTHTHETQEEAPEGAVQRDRMGVRYPELLAFIIAAI